MKRKAFISGLNISTEHQKMPARKIKLCLMKAASQRTQLPDVKLKQNVSYGSLKIYKHLTFPAIDFLLIKIYLCSIFICQTVRCV